MRTSFRTVIAVTLMLGIVVVGCGGGSDDKPSGEHPPVTGTFWLMQSFTASDGKVTEMHQGVRLPSLVFTVDKTVVVFDGCNSGGGKATVGDDTIEFGPLRSTLMACPGETDDVSKAVTTVLNGTADYTFGDKDLVLSNNGTSLTYSAGDGYGL